MKHQEDPARTQAAAEQLDMSVRTAQPTMIRLAHLALINTGDRPAALAGLFRQLVGPRYTTVVGLYADALIRIAEYEQRDALAGRVPAPPAGDELPPV